MTNRAFDKSKYANWIDPALVVPYPHNAKIHTEKQIKNVANSIRRFGWQQDTVLTRDNVLVIGHGRRLAALQIGCEMPFHMIDKDADELTDEDIRELRIADNQTNAETGLDIAILAPEIADLTFDGFDFDFDIPGLEEEPEPVEAPVPDVEEPTAKPGDLYRLGRHRLICGDSTDPGTIARLMETAAADLLLTDPPYNVNVGSFNIDNRNHDHILNDSMEESDFIAFLTKALETANNHLMPGAAFYIFYAGLHHIEFETALRNVPELLLKEQLVWIKNHFAQGVNDYRWAHEPILYGWKDGTRHYFTDSRAERTVIEDKEVKLTTMKKGELVELAARLLGLDSASTVFRADKPAAADLHPTVKPQEILCRFVRNSTKPGQLVLDLFGGSGSTLIACEQTDRACYMCELDPHYVDVIIKRWEMFTGETAEKIN